MVAAIWILLTIALVIIVISIIMAPGSNMFSGALVGSSDLDLFKISKERGSKKILKWLMFSFGLLMMIIALIARAFV